MRSISVIIPVFNSELSVGKVIQELDGILPTLTDTFEVILVEDDSRDNSWSVVHDLALHYTWVRAFKLMRNYGQHNALLCGIRAAKYDIIVTMDDDQQHPAEKIQLLLEKLNEGYDVVYGSPLKQRHGFLRDMASQVTKLVLQKTMGADTARNISAFRAFRASLRDGFVDFQGPSVNIDVLLTWSTDRFTAINVPHRPRELGRSNYTFRKLVDHTFNMMTGFSTIPLRFASWIGFAMTAFGLLLLFYIIVIRLLIFGYEVPGFTFLASMVALFAGAQTFTIGIIGEYLARMYFRTMDRPAFIVREEVHNIDAVAAPESVESVSQIEQS